MSTYKSKHTGERVDNAVTKIPENLPVEDSVIVIGDDGSPSYKAVSEIGDKIEIVQTTGTATDAVMSQKAVTDELNKNIKDGAGAFSLNQVQDGTTGTFDFTGKNLNATAIDPTLTGQIPYGATGDFASSFGGKGAAQGKRSFQAGTTTIAKGNYSAAFGDNSVALGNDSFTANYENVSSGLAAASFGQKTLAGGEASFTEGTGSVVRSVIPASSSGGSSGGSSSGGSGTVTQPDDWNDNDHLGNSTHVEGRGGVGYGVAAHIGGMFNTGYGHASYVSGSSSRVGATVYARDKLVVKGGTNSFAHGKNLVVVGSQSGSFGENNKVLADSAFSSGYNNVITEDATGSATVGSNNIVGGENSFAAGLSNNIGGGNSFAAGYGNTVSHMFSGAVGVRLRASTPTQFVVGKYNDINYQALFIVGGGSDSTYANMFEVLNDGRAKVYAPPVNNNDVVRKQELDTKYDKAGGTIGGNVVITGDLTVNGTQHINNTENLNVENAMIYSNAKGATLATNGGIGIKKNATDVYGIVYDPTSDSVKLGLGKSDANGVFTFNANEGQPVAIRDDSAKLVNNNLVKWDATNHKLIDAGKNVDNLIDKLPASLINQAYVRNANGEDTGLAYTYTDEGNTLALRNASGQVQVSTPLQDNDAANKKFVEDKLTALNIQNGTGNKSLQQVIDSDFTLVNINSDRTGQTIQSGAVGVFAATFGGKSRSEGKRAFSAGTQTIATGNYSAAFGNNSISEGVNSFVEGSQNISRGNSSHAENANNLAAADNTHVEGVENTATHMGAHVQGYKNGSFGDYTHTEGGENVSSTAANVTYSHIGGYKNTMVITGTANPDASGGSTPGGGESTSQPTEFWATFIDGAKNKASGTNSFTIGYENQNYGNGTFIAGHHNIIYNNVETAMLFGRQLQGGRNCQVVFGENNLLNKDALLIVGNGTGVTGPNRFSNAFEVLKDGRAKVQTAPKEDNDVVRTLELNNVNARYVSTSILGG